ncbi:UNVERIFIED_CONTAM: hypothetical protein FKN15_001975 [Acipenser sinensis]
MELEQNRAIVRDQRTELSTLRKQLAGMSELVEKKKAELQSAVDELRQCKADLERQRSILNEKESQCEKLEEEPKGEGRDSQTPEHRVSSQEQAVQQVAIMRRELAELRSQQAISDNHNQDTVFGSNWLTNGTVAPPYAPAAIIGQGSCVLERTPAGSSPTSTVELLGVKRSFTFSSVLYLDLVRALASLLNVGELLGFSSLKHALPDEREHLISQRHTDLELLHTRLCFLHSQLERKEELLSGYQRDLEQLRCFRLRWAIIQYCVIITDYEDPLYACVLTFHLEQLEKRSVKTPSHSCVQEDMRGKVRQLPEGLRIATLLYNHANKNRGLHREAKKAALQGKLKKKGYKIETLKKQLCKQD